VAALTVRQLRCVLLSELAALVAFVHDIPTVTFLLLRQADPRANQLLLTTGPGVRIHTSLSILPRRSKRNIKVATTPQGSMVYRISLSLSLPFVAMVSFLLHLAGYIVLSLTIFCLLNNRGFGPPMTRSAQQSLHITLVTVVNFNCERTQVAMLVASYQRSFH
jgi:hypothetical protein